MAMGMSGYVDMLCNVTGLQSIHKCDAIPSVEIPSVEIPTDHKGWTNLGEKFNETQKDAKGRFRSGTGRMVDGNNNHRAGREPNRIGNALKSIEQEGVNGFRVDARLQKKAHTTTTATRPGSTVFVEIYILVTDIYLRTDMVWAFSFNYKEYLGYLSA